MCWRHDTLITQWRARLGSDVRSRVVVNTKKVDRLVDQLDVTTVDERLQLWNNPVRISARQEWSQKTAVPQIIMSLDDCSRLLRVVSRYTSLQIQGSAQLP